MFYVHWDTVRVGMHHLSDCPFCIWIDLRSCSAVFEDGSDIGIFCGRRFNPLPISVGGELLCFRSSDLDVFGLLRLVPNEDDMRSSAPI